MSLGYTTEGTKVGTLIMQEKHFKIIVPLLSVLEVITITHSPLLLITHKQQTVMQLALQQSYD